MKQFIRITLLIVFVLCVSLAFSQEGSLPIGLTQLDGIRYPTIYRMNASQIQPGFLVKPGFRLDRYFETQFALQPLMDTWADYKNNKITREQFNTYYNRRRRDAVIDSTRFTADKLNNKIKILIGISGNILYFIPDANNNGVYSDDTPLLTVDTLLKNRDTLCNYTVSNIEMYDGRKEVVNNVSVSVKLNLGSATVKGDLTTLRSKGDLIEFVVKNHTSGHVVVNGKGYQVFVSSSPFHSDLDFFNPSIQIFGDSDTINARSIMDNVFKKQEYVSGDTLLLGDRFFVIDGLYDHNSILKVNQIKQGRYTGRLTGFYYPDFTAERLPDMKLFKSNELTGRYTVIDFWGTWCLPCIKLFPDLKATVMDLKNKYKDQLQYVSVLFDERKNIDSANILMDKLGLGGIRLFDDRKLASPAFPVKRFAVNCYPTTILIDKENKIIARGCGEEILKEIRKILL